jgi:hypothetical protein
MSISVIATAIGADNYPFQGRKLTGNRPRLQALFVSPNKFVSLVSWSQSQRPPAKVNALASVFGAFSSTKLSIATYFYRYKLI